MKQSITGLFRSAVSGLVATLLIGSSAFAQSWPSRPVRLIVPFAAGGGADAVARTVATKLSERWGQPVMVDNKPGGNTVVAASELVRAAPDGYTLFQAMNSTLSLNPYLFAKLPYDPLKDFTHISAVAAVPLVYVVNEQVPARNTQELIALARKQPGRISIGGASVAIQLAIERFSRDAGVKFSYVPYKTGVEITKGIMSGEIQVGMDAAVQYQPLAKSGKLRIVATSNPRKIASLPEVPTLKESGLKNSDAVIWHGISAPAGLPTSIKQKIESDLKEVLAMPDVVTRMAELGLEPSWLSSDDYVKAVRQESAAFGPLIKELGLKME